MWAALIPQAGGQSRAYFVYPKTTGYRLQGESMLQSFRAASPRKPTLPSRIIAPTRKVSDHWRALMSATLGWSILIAMASRCLAMLRQLQTQPTARGFLSLCAVRACFATN